TLARMGGRAGEGSKNWLLLKERDVEARPDGESDLLAERPESGADEPDEPLPERLAPQLATLAEAPPRGDDWLHEIKYDGYRIVCRLEDGRVQLFTRSGQDWAARLVPIARACAALPARTTWLGGEIVVFEDG